MPTFAPPFPPDQTLIWRVLDTHDDNTVVFMGRKRKTRKFYEMKIGNRKDNKEYILPTSDKGGYHHCVGLYDCSVERARELVVKPIF